MIFRVTLLYLYLYVVRRPHPKIGNLTGNGIGGALRLVALASQRSLKSLCGLLVYHRVREGVPGYGGPGEEGEFILAGF